jgi:hypothetical protein
VATTSADDRLIAAVMLVGNTGAKELEYGYLHDDVPVDQAGWWASARYLGAKIAVEDQRGPLEALEALAERLLTSARCTWCSGLVALSSDGAVAFPGVLMADGSTLPRSPEEIAALGQCLWRRIGRRWEPGCLHDASTAPNAPKSRAQRRQLRRVYEASRPVRGG